MRALHIPIGTFHRSVSGEDDSLVLNQSVRDQNFNYAKNSSRSNSATVTI